MKPIQKPGKENGLDYLPRGWALTTLGEISERPEYGWTTSANAISGNIKLLRTTDISKKVIDWSSVPYCAKNPPDLDRFSIRPGDIVISRAGSVGLSALIEESPPAVFASYLIRFRPATHIDRRYVSYFLKSPSYWSAIAASAAGIALQNVNAKKLAAISLPLAPVLEQHRVVAEIEKQFTRLDAAVAALKRVRANLNRYRASVLKAACEGRFVPTEAELARAERRDYEPADMLLQRILEERRAKWEADHRAGFRTKGKAPKDEEWRPKYREPAKLEIDALPCLPEGWCWTTVEQLAVKVQYGTSAKTSSGVGGVPVIRMGNISNGRLVLGSLKYLPKCHLEFPELLLVDGDVLFNRTNSAELVGKTAVYRGIPSPCSFASYLIRVRLANGFEPDGLAYFLNSTLGRSWVWSVVSQQVGQANVNGSKLQSLRIPLAPQAEQHRIVAEVERTLSVIEELEALVAANLKRAERLRQSILKRAFEGKLVPQHPSDEPASVLLERIRAERETAAQASKTALRTGSRPEPKNRRKR